MNDKLIKIQKELKAPKSNWNSFGKYHSRSAEDILEAVKPLVHKEGLTLTLSDDIINVGNSNYVKSTATLSDGENSIPATALARESETQKGMSDPQITGSASSYARKYAMCGLFAIDDTKDDDTKDNSQHTAKKVEPKPAPVDPLAKAKNELNNMLVEYGHDNDVKKKLIINKVLEKNSVDSEQEANEVMQALTDGAV